MHDKADGNQYELTHFCNDQFNRCESLKKHLEHHKIANKQNIKVTHKPHLMTRGKKAEKRNFCVWNVTNYWIENTDINTFHYDHEAVR